MYVCLSADVKKNYIVLTLYFLLFKALYSTWMKSVTHNRHILMKWASSFAIECQRKIVHNNSLFTYNIYLFQTLYLISEQQTFKINFSKYVSLHADFCTIIFHKNYNCNCSKLLMKYLLPSGNILKILMLCEHRYLHRILIESLTLLSLYIQIFSSVYLKFGFCDFQKYKLCANNMSLHLNVQLF